MFRVLPCCSRPFQLYWGSVGEPHGTAERSRVASQEAYTHPVLQEPEDATGASRLQRPIPCYYLLFGARTGHCEPACSLAGLEGAAVGVGFERLEMERERLNRRRRG